MEQSSPRIVAAFDFDGTLTRGDSLFPFLWYYQRGTRFFVNLLRSSATLVLYVSKLLNNNIAKARVLNTFLKGDKEADLLKAGIYFSEHILPKLLRQNAMARFQWHLQQGHECILISASMNIYLEPWANQTGFDHVICSRLEMINGYSTGRLLGGNCYGEEKARRLREYLDGDNITLYAYGDSRGDKELLDMADYGYYRIIPEN